jgi:hypothetical protein
MGDSLLPPRRWYGLLCLILGGFMLLWGQTVLHDRLTGRSFVIYWTLCFLVTGSALVISLWDTHRLRRQMRAQEKELFKRMIDQVERARREKGESPDGKSEDDQPQAG